MLLEVVRLLGVKETCDDSRLAFEHRLGELEFRLTVLALAKGRSAWRQDGQNQSQESPCSPSWLYSASDSPQQIAWIQGSHLSQKMACWESLTGPVQMPHGYFLSGPGLSSTSPASRRISHTAVLVRDLDDSESVSLRCESFESWVRLCILSLASCGDILICSPVAEGWVDESGCDRCRWEMSILKDTMISVNFMTAEVRKWKFCSDGSALQFLARLVTNCSSTLA